MPIDEFPSVTDLTASARDSGPTSRYVPASGGDARSSDGQRIMIIDDVPVNIKVAKAHLHAAGYRDFAQCTDATEAVHCVQQQTPDIVLLDLMMPNVSGLDILETLRSEPTTALLPILVLTGTESREMRNQALRLGATDFLTKPVDSDELIHRVRNALLIKSYQDDLEEKVRERTREIELSRRDLIHRLAKAGEFRDNESDRHVVRVGRYASLIANKLGLGSERVEMIGTAATLHDLGKIGVPDEIPTKPGKLTPEEFQLIQSHCDLGKLVCECMTPEEHETFASHTLLGAQIMKGCRAPILDLAGTIALTHHENWDGSGYPLGLSGEDIPIEGRIVAVADVFDALSSKRTYKPAFPIDHCFELLQQQRGIKFDPVVLDAFLACKSEIVSIQIENADLH